MKTKKLRLKVKSLFAVNDHGRQFQINEYPVIRESEGALLVLDGTFRILVNKTTLKSPVLGQMHASKSNAVAHSKQTIKKRLEESKQQMEYWRKLSKLSQKDLFAWMDSTGASDDRTVSIAKRNNLPGGGNTDLPLVNPEETVRQPVDGDAQNEPSKVLVSTSLDIPAVLGGVDKVAENLPTESSLGTSLEGEQGSCCL